MSFCPEHRAEYERLVEKLCTAIAGEERRIVLFTVAMFARTMCESLGVPVERFIELLRDEEPPKAKASA